MCWAYSKTRLIEGGLYTFGCYVWAIFYRENRYSDNVTFLASNTTLMVIEANLLGGPFLAIFHKFAYKAMRVVPRTSPKIGC